ncbi:major facilitator superfamily mfs_1 protein [Sphingomonas sp. LH128]|uniref:MFS transporter n=1 Tax=Novosphingobium resinovorum TaxID=158500 RepID=A0A1D8AFD1_9SPHN|nr:MULTISPECIES: MFS transporter [Sphingomonadaceae]AOR80815.1 MFS transporter [Novosphingobium resinovorum]EJU08942.1 major facilitator superfamily mfs_1 protein [Sphingomonas sp. LH128]
MEDPRAIIAREPMHHRQVLTVAVATALNALDGFDVLSISFASPGIARDWGITRAALGAVLSMELIGMGIGAFVLGSIADRIGRRPTILVCLAIMGLGMALASTAGDVTTLSLFRLFTGLGIGGMLAATGAIVAECSNARRRNLSVAIMAGGYPIGAIVGGSIASVLLEVTGRWQSVFEFGAVMTLCFIPLVIKLVPETIAFLLHKRPANALDRINRTMVRQGRAPLADLPPVEERPAGPGLAQLFGPGVRTMTLLLTLVYFGHMMSFYFFVKWIPKIIVDMGFAAASAGGVLVWANVGGALGSLSVSLASQRVGVRPLVAGAMCCGAVAICVFGYWPTTIATLSIMAGIGGFFTNGATAGLYAVIAQCFPAHLRAGGTGLVIGVGRAGAALGPVLAGLLFTAGWSLGPVATIMALGTLVAGIVLMMLRYRESAIA